MNKNFFSKGNKKADDFSRRKDSMLLIDPEQLSNAVQLFEEVVSVKRILEEVNSSHTK